jgi:hypothetical protein
MDATAIKTTLEFYLREIRIRLDEVASIARAAEACMDAGNVPKSVEIALGIEQPIYEVTTFLNAASTMHRLQKKD